MAAITTAAMNGDLDLDQSLQKRLDILEPTVDKLAACIASNPAQSRLVPGIQELIEGLQNRNIEVLFISGGFRMIDHWEIAITYGSEDLIRRNRLCARAGKQKPLDVFGARNLYKRSSWLEMVLQT